MTQIHDHHVHVDERLAALESHIPSQSHTNLGFDLVVTAWFGRKREFISVVHTEKISKKYNSSTASTVSSTESTVSEGGNANRFNEIVTHESMVNLEYGIRKAEIVILVDGGRISPIGRLQILAKKIDVTQFTEKKYSSQSGGNFGFILKRFISLSGSYAILNELSNGSKMHEEHSEKFWLLADAGPSFWVLDGKNLNADGLLEFRVVGDDAICRIDYDDGRNGAQVAAFIRFNTRDIWCKNLSNTGAAWMRRVQINQNVEIIENNRLAVARALLARAIRVENKERSSGRDGEVILSEHVFSICNDENKAESKNDD